MIATRPLRILVLSNMYPPHHLGGYELSCFDIVERLRARGHTITVLTTTMRVAGVADPVDERPGGIRRDLLFYWDDHRLVSPSLPRRIAIEKANQRALEEALSAARPDVVSVWNMGAMSLGLLTTIAERGLPMVFSVCDDWLIYGRSLDAWSRLFSERPMMGRAARRLTGVPAAPADLGTTGTFLFISDSVRRAVGTVSQAAAKNGTVVYSGIDHHLFPDRDGARRSGPWSWRLLYAGRLDERKGVHVAIEALTRLPDVAGLEINGRGDPAYVSSLRELTARLGLQDRVRFRTDPRQELHRRYENADVVVFPVLWAEPFGLVPVEAMACGTPVVATGMGGSAEYLADGVNALVTPPADADALAAAVRRLAGDEELRTRLMEGGRQTGAELDIERLADAMETWHVAAADRFAHGRPADRPSPLQRLGLAVGDEDAMRSPRSIGEAFDRHRAGVERALASGDPAEIKRVYVELGDLLESAVQHEDSEAPVLSLPETAPVVSGLLSDALGLVLDAGCGPNPVISMAVGRDGRCRIVGVDLGLGIVRLARAVARGAGISFLPVVADVEALPFKDAAFDAGICDDTIEHLPRPEAGVDELARVLRDGARLVIATPNRHSADVLYHKLRDRLHGRRRPASAYYLAESHLREYTWTELERLIRPAFLIRRRAAVGWHGPSWKRRLATRLTGIASLRRLARMVVVEVEPRRKASARLEQSAVGERPGPHPGRR